MDDDDSPGVPEWVVTYGDMMSLLLTFFIMLVSLSEVVADEKYRAILNSLQKYIGYRTSVAAPPGDHYPLDGMRKRLETLGSFVDDEKGFGGVKTRAIEGKDIRVFRTRDGVEIRVGDLVLFDRHTAEIPTDARQTLDRIAETLAGKPNKVEIRAYTSGESLPVGSPFVDQYQLAYERGRNVLLYLTQRGIDRSRLRISALGDSQMEPHNDRKRSISPDRAEVLILDAFADEFRGRR